jgi:hypothetical protein
MVTSRLRAACNRSLISNIGPSAALIATKGHHVSLFLAEKGVVAGTPVRLILCAVCSLEDALDAAQIQR